MNTANSKPNIDALNNVPSPVEPKVVFSDVMFVISVVPVADTIATRIKAPTNSMMYLLASVILNHLNLVYIRCVLYLIF